MAKAPHGDGPAAAADALESLTYEELVERLEELTDRLSSGEVGIEEAADLYDAARKVHAAAFERLERVRTRIEALENGEPGG